MPRRKAVPPPEPIPEPFIQPDLDTAEAVIAAVRKMRVKIVFRLERTRRIASVLEREEISANLLLVLLHQANDIQKENDAPKTDR
jgi:hypothetical protein